MQPKTIVITGATSGIGKQTALQLAKMGHTLYLLARNPQKVQQTCEQMIAATNNANIHYLVCDLADLNSVKKAANQLLLEKLPRALKAAA